MTVRYEDLPLQVRRLVAERVEAETRRPARPRPASSTRWRCFACGELFRHEAAAMRHGNQPGHHRIEVCVL